MTGLLGSGMLVMIVADSAVGVRLLLLARRTRELPELWLGSCFLLLGTLGYPLAVAARRGLFPSPEAAGVALAVALTAQNLAALAMYLANHQVFRPGRRWPRVLATAAAAAFAASLIGHAATVGFVGARDGGSWYYLGFAARLLPFAWAALEALRYQAQLRRRRRLGMANALAVNRMRLWAVTTSSITLAFVVFLIGRLSGAAVAESPAVLGVSSIAGLVSGVAVWLLFFPPVAYRRWVRQGEAA